MHQNEKHITTILLSLVFTFLLSTCGAKQPPYYGAFIKDGNDFIEIPEIEILGIPNPSGLQELPSSPDSQPVIVFWNPQVQIKKLVLVELISMREIEYTVDPVDEEILHFRPRDPLEPGMYCFIQGDPMAVFLSAWCFSVGDLNEISIFPAGVASPQIVPSEAPPRSNQSSTSVPLATTTLEPLPLKLSAYNYTASEPRNGWIDASFFLAIENIGSSTFSISQTPHVVKDNLLSFLQTGGMIVETREGPTYKVSFPYYGLASQTLALPGPIPPGFRFAHTDYSYAFYSGSPMRFEFTFAEAATPTRVTLLKYPYLSFELPQQNDPEAQISFDDFPVELHPINHLAGVSLESENLRITFTGKCIDGDLETEMKNLDMYNDTDLYPELYIPVFSIDRDTGGFLSDTWWEHRYGPGLSYFEESGRRTTLTYLGPGQSQMVLIETKIIEDNQIFYLLDNYYDTSGCFTETGSPTAFSTEGPNPTSTPPTTSTPLSISEISVTALVDEWTRFISGEIHGISLSHDRAGETKGSLVVALNDNSERLVVLRESDGQWDEDWSVPIQAHWSTSLLVTDVDGDGVNEVLLGSDHVYIYKYSEGSFSLAWSSREEFGINLSPRIAVSDMDHDGYNELVVLNYKKSEPEYDDMKSLYVYASFSRQMADFVLAYATTFTDGTGYHYSYGVAVADFNGDGSSEIVVGNDNGYLWLVSKVGKDYAVRREWNVPSGGAIGRGLGSGDLDADGIAELLVGTNGGDIFVFKFDEELRPFIVASAMAGRLSYGIASADTDNDGTDEFVVGRGDSDYAEMTREDVVIEVWELNGNNLQRSWSLQTVDQPFSITPYDLDNDGLIEIITIGLGNGEVEIIRMP